MSSEHDEPVVMYLRKQGPGEVTAADIEAVWADEALRTEFRRRFDWTLNLAPIARHLTLLHRRSEFRAAPDSVNKMMALVGEGKIESFGPRDFAGH